MSFLLLFSEEGDDDDDPEYNFLAEIDEPDVEDYRNDRAVRITSELPWWRDGVSLSRLWLSGIDPHLQFFFSFFPTEKEVNQLMEELFETVRDCVLCCFFSLFLLLCGCLCVFIFLCVLQFQDELTAQEQDEEGHEEEREEEAPALGKPTFSTPPDIPLVYPHIYARHIHTVLLFCYGVIFTSTLCCRRFWGQLNSISQIKFLTV